MVQAVDWETDGLVTQTQLIDAGHLGGVGTQAELAVLAHLDAVNDKPLTIAGLLQYKSSRVTGTLNCAVDVELVAVTSRQTDKDGNHQ